MQFKKEAQRDFELSVDIATLKSEILKSDEEQMQNSCIISKLTEV